MSGYAQQPRPYARNPNPNKPVFDDSEWWFDNQATNNRMVLSLKSGIQKEVDWALNRLLLVSVRENFSLSLLPGLLDALFEWPKWYIQEGHLHLPDNALFAVSRDASRKRKHALDSLSILRNSSLHDQSISDVTRHPETLLLIEKGLETLDPIKASNTEFLLLLLELLLAIGPTVVLPDVLPEHHYLYTIQRIASESPNRSLIIAAFSVLNLLLSTPMNTQHVLSADKAMDAAARYLPLFSDVELLDVCVNHIYVHLSLLSTAKDFLLRKDMPSILRVLVGAIRSQQQETLETYVLPPPYAAVPALSLAWPNHQLTEEEFNRLMTMQEPTRCHEWMRIMFEPREGGEVTQVEFWTLYRDVFEPRQEENPLLAAQEVIKGVNTVYPDAQAMVIPATNVSPQRFVVRGVDRRKDYPGPEQFECKWDRGQCQAPMSHSAKDLYDHILEHLATTDESQLPCLWGNCPAGPFPRAALRSHVLTHISTIQIRRNPPSQSTDITMQINDTYPIQDPTRREIPPPRGMMVNVPVPTQDPTSIALTALLCIRILYRASFTVTDTSPKADADHFGFPGAAEDEDRPTITAQALEQEREAQKRGKKAFSSVRGLLEEVRIRDEVLQSWIDEMIDVFGLEQA